MKLRAYEADWVKRLKSAKKRRILAVGSTGCGKTVVAAHLIRDAVESGKRVLFLAHRRELIHQARQRLVERGVPKRDIGLILAGEPESPEALVQVASVQTLVRRDVPDARVVFVDEAHHATAKSYQAILSLLPRARVYGLTATPYRLDGKPLGDLFDVIVETEPPSRLVELGFLSQPKVFTVPEGERPKLKRIRMRGGDFDQTELAAASRGPKLLGSIVDHWKRLAEGRATVAYSVDVEHGRDICSRFNRSKIKAELVTGETPNEERQAILGRLTSGATKVVVNCMVLTEGWDCPMARCAIIARATNSQALWFQMCGRVMRPGEVEPIILDHAGNALRMPLPGTDIEHSLEESQQKSISVTVAREKECPECGSIVGFGTRTCPFCGHEFWEKEPPEEVQGYLREVSGIRGMTKEEELEACKLYPEGMSSHQLAEKFGVSADAIRNCLRRNGVKVRTNLEANGRLTPVQEAEVCKLYPEGMNSHQLAEKFGVCAHAVLNCLRRNGVKVRTNLVLTPVQEAEVCKLYPEGMNSLQLAEKFGVSVHAVLNCLRRNGVKVRTKLEVQLRRVPSHSSSPTGDTT